MSSNLTEGTRLDSYQMNLGRYRASLREIEKKPVHSQVGYKVGSSPTADMDVGSLPVSRFDSLTDYAKNTDGVSLPRKRWVLEVRLVR